jgi:hypothetical protein
LSENNSHIDKLGQPSIRGGVHMIKKSQLALTSLVTAFFGMFYYLICYNQFPYGDDVLMQFSTGISFYLDIPNPALGKQITSLPIIFESVLNIYKVWSGRIVGSSLNPMLTILGRKFTAGFSAIVFLLIVFNIATLIDSHKENNMKVFQNPVRLILLNLMIFVLGGFKGLMTMWVMVSIYGVSTLLYLIMLNITIGLCKNDFNSKVAYIIFINIIGFAAGLTHEVIGAISILMIFIKCFEVFWKKKVSFFNIIYHYIGLILGYFICFIAPGNFVRMNSSHDEGIRKPFLTKLQSSLDAHSTVIYGYKNIFALIIIVLLIYCVIKVRIKKVSNLKVIIASNYQFILGIIFSIIIWSFGSYVPSYGLLFYMCLVCIIFFRIYDECTKSNTLNIDRFKYKVATPITLLLLALIFIYNYAWLSNLRSVTRNREILIDSAKNNSYDTAVVPAYKDVNNLFYTTDNSGNNQESFDSEYYIEYYGIHIIIDK